MIKDIASSVEIQSIIRKAGGILFDKKLLMATSKTYSGLKTSLINVGTFIKNSEKLQNYSNQLTQQSVDFRLAALNHSDDEIDNSKTLDAIEKLGESIDGLQAKAIQKEEKHDWVISDNFECVERKVWCRWHCCSRYCRGRHLYFFKKRINRHK